MIKNIIFSGTKIYGSFKVSKIEAAFLKCCEQDNEVISYQPLNEAYYLVLNKCRSTVSLTLNYYVERQNNKHQFIALKTTSEPLSTAEILLQFLVKQKCIKRGAELLIKDNFPFENLGGAK